MEGTRRPAGDGEGAVYAARKSDEMRLIRRARGRQVASLRLLYGAATQDRKHPGDTPALPALFT